MTAIIPATPPTLFHGLLLHLHCPELPTTAFTCSPVPSAVSCHLLLGHNCSGLHGCKSLPW